MNELRRLGLEAGPLLVFFFGNVTWGIITATGLYMIATAIAVALSLWLERRVPVMPLVASVFVLIFGGLTVWLDDALFIKLKPTITNLLLAGVLLAGLLTNRNPLRMLLATSLELDGRGWTILTRRWIGFFILLAGLNELVWRTMSTDWWVNFKVFGILPLSLAFGLAQMPLILRHQVDGQQEQAAPDSGETPD